VLSLWKETGADQVREFYEQYPYPRPVDSLENYARLWKDQRRRRADFHLFWPAKAYREDYVILIAGCGTSQAAKHALRWPSAQVVGVDFSATSIASTEKLKREYHLTNLQIHNFPIEQIRDLGIRFDQIVCTGVLHHLADPDVGLRALHDVLKPDGAMHLMLYAPYGRAGIYLMQDFCRRIGIDANDSEIRDLIVALAALPPGHPLENLMRLAPDFREEATLADALLHPQDRAYSVPQLFDFIKKGGFTFGRWLRQAPYTPGCGAMAKIPQANRIRKLSLENQYAIAELFRGTMVNHSLIIYRNDNPVPQEVSFMGSAWLRYVPIRMAETVCVQERLPPEAAGVLINQNHTYTDLILPISPTEKILFDAIDGNSDIDEIIHRTLPSSKELTEKARDFFERLWWYDQVVYQTSR